MTFSLLATRTVALCVAFCFSLLSTAVVWGQTSNALTFDVIAPVILHAPSASPGLAGEPQTITATITDNQSLLGAVLFYRSDNSRPFDQIVMMRGTDNAWFASVETGLSDQQIEYYLTARDLEGNRVEKGGPDTPLVLQLLQPTTAPLVTGAGGTGTAVNNTGATGTAGNTASISESDSLDRAGNPATRWLLIGLGVLAVGALAASSGGGGGGGGGSGGGGEPAPCCTVTFVAPNAANGN